jgi:hypothetical protein
VNEEDIARVGLQRHIKKKYWFYIGFVGIIVFTFVQQRFGPEINL